MKCSIIASPCQPGAPLPLLPYQTSLIPSHFLKEGDALSGAGWEFADEKGAVFIVCGQVWLPAIENHPAGSFPLLLAKRQIETACFLNGKLSKNGHAVAVITLSDKGSQGARKDTAGPLAANMIAEAIPVSISQNFLLPDESMLLRGLLAELALTQKYDLVCTCGGTGLGPRDITPQATESVLDFPLPGFAEAMRGASLSRTPNAIISRAICGVTGRCLILNLPGSAKAVTENLAVILPGLGHALAKLQGDSHDCGG